MERKSSGRKCCCIGGYCRKLTNESDCLREGGRVVENCSECS